MRILYVNEKVYNVVIIARQAEIIPAVAESCFGVLKRERVNRYRYRTRPEARSINFYYIERHHNPGQRRRLELEQ